VYLSSPPFFKLLFTCFSQTQDAYHVRRTQEGFPEILIHNISTDAKHVFADMFTSHVYSSTYKYTILSVQLASKYASSMMVTSALCAAYGKF